MIETIIKLDGTHEEFQAAKPNRWMEWGTEHLKDKVDWTSIVLEATASLPKVVSSQDFQMHLIETILAGRTWSHYLLAGRLYAVWLQKHLYGIEGTPTVKALHTRMQKDNLMVKLNYTTQDYLKVEKFINHDIDFEQPHFALHQIRKKYALANRVTGKEYESPQFTYMRMAMALAENEPKATRIQVVRDYYELFSRKQLSAPTPNYINLGTVHRGFASCCLFASGDNGTSLAIGNFIGDKMTQMSAGIGVNIMTRAVGDAVRNGLFLHHGKKKYYDSMGKSIVANTQAGRGGAVTCFFEAFDQEADMIQALRNPRSTEDRRNRDMHFAMLSNVLFAQKAMKKENIFAFNPHTAPDLHEAFYGKDIELFKTLYAKYEADPKFVKHYASARDVLRRSLVEAQETGVAYVGQIDEINRHTPFREPIRSSNLCMEIAEPTAPYYDMMDLYSTEDHGRGEIATCSLAAVSVENIHDKETYQKVCYYALKMIDYCILNSSYVFPHLEMTAKARMSAGVGIMGLATHMAREGLKYSSDAGKQEIHFIAERHMFYLIEASLKISKERGLAPWMHKTLWPEGWLPIDTYKRSVDNIKKDGTNFDMYYKWEQLRAEIIANGGIGHSVLCAYMPGESSSKALGGCNSVYPARRLTLSKNDQNNLLYWAAPYGDDPAYKYEMAWDIPTKDMIDCYAIIQKFCDQSISADLWRRIVGNEQIDSNELLKNYFYMVQMGMKTRYYFNTETTANLSLEAMESAHGNVTEDTDCGSGACKM